MFPRPPPFHVQKKTRSNIVKPPTTSSNYSVFRYSSDAFVLQGYPWGLQGKIWELELEFDQTSDLTSDRIGKPLLVRELWLCVILDHFALISGKCDWTITTRQNCF